MPKSSKLNAYSVKEDQLRWIDVSAVPGAKLAVVFGDPSKAGLVILRFHFPANGQTPPHFHPYDEYTTVLKGKVYYGEGETFDASTPQVGEVGDFAIVPAYQAHFVWTGDEDAIVQLQFDGPASMSVVSAANPG